MSSSSLLPIDGSAGEGGGQILRSSLSLALATGRGFHIRRIRASRSPPGLARQHLTAVRAAAEIGSATVEGAELGSGELVFRPGAVRPGEYRFDTGGAGSTTLVAQTILVPLLTAGGASRFTVVGGTHNPAAPPFEFLARSFLPRLRGMGARVSARLEEHGFYPAGGGRIAVEVEPAPGLERLEIVDRGDEVERRATAVVSALPRHIAERELSIVHAMLDLRPDALELVEISAEDAPGPGNAVMIELAFENVTALFTGFGKKGKPAETVATEACREARDYLRSGAPVCPRLADQLLVPMAAGPGGRFATLELSSHTRTVASIVERFTGREVEWRERSDGSWLVEIPD